MPNLRTAGAGPQLSLHASVLALLLLGQAPPMGRRRRILSSGRLNIARAYGFGSAESKADGDAVAVKRQKRSVPYRPGPSYVVHIDAAGR
ncbi:MAG: hypothetical protein AT711_07920 [Thermoproteus sp. CIS_19]|jgi:hypothetical protein|nr:MAG: hypothetical protein AT711_07920 [Thermoproteus sp. CIS_19]